MTQAVLGAKAGMRQATVSEVEKGLSSARIDTILDLLAALDLEFCVSVRSKDWAMPL
jgi:HTH-type transcriptional regulator/antitoxin HipB